MNTYKNLASIAILSVVLVAPILALASTDSAGPGAMVLPGNLPCQAEFKAYNAKYPPQLPSGMPKPGSGGVPLPSISTTSMAGAVPTGMGDINKDSNMNSAEGKALQEED